MSHSADAISGTHLTQATAAAFRSTPTGRSTLDQLQSYYSPSSEDESGTPSFIRRPPATPGTAQTVNTTLTSDQFHHLILNLTESIRSSTVPSVPREDNPFAVARAEVYISQGLTFKFDGTTDSLAPWIKKFKSLRSSALWHEATYLTHAGTTYDILTEFTKIKEAYVKPQAEQRCTQENHLKSLKPENTTLFYARILGKVVISSVTDDFCTILQNYAGDELASDGPYLLWLLLTHFHTSTITYQDQLKTKIRGRTLASDHQDDVESYLLWLRHHLDVLATISLTGIAGHSDLIEPIFKQLLSTTSTRLRRIIEDWHLLYHSEEKVLTPHSLVVDSDKNVKHCAKVANFIPQQMPISWHYLVHTASHHRLYSQHLGNKLLPAQEGHPTQMAKRAANIGLLVHNGLSKRQLTQTKLINMRTEFGIGVPNVATQANGSALILRPHMLTIT